MKLFHTENGKEVVYVQMHDIMELNQRDLLVPASIYTKVYKDSVIIVDNSNRFEFVRFDEAYEVEFFKKLEFILDYDKYKDMNEDELQGEWDKLAIKVDEIAEKWNSMSKEERADNENLLEEYDNLKHMLYFLSVIYSIKNNKLTMPFPEFVSGKNLPQNKTPFWKKFFCWKKCK